MGLGKGKVPSKRTHFPHPDIGDVPLHQDKSREVLLEERGISKLAVR